jgi:hypothetical protein
MYPNIAKKNKRPLYSGQIPPVPTESTVPVIRLWQDLHSNSDDAMLETDQFLFK